MFTSGRRFFSAGSIGLIVVAGLHTMGHFSSRRGDAVLDTLEAGMKAYSFDMGMGMAPNLYGILQALSLTMSVTMFGLGVQNLAIASSAAATPGMIRRLSVVSAIVTGGLVVIYGVYRIPPPFITIAIVAVLFVIASFTSGRAS